MDRDINYQFTLEDITNRPETKKFIQVIEIGKRKYGLLAEGPVEFDSKYRVATAGLATKIILNEVSLLRKVQISIKVEEKKQ